MASDEIVIHARYTADGRIEEISERPESLTHQQWFNFLCKAVPFAAKPLAGGRMVFRLPIVDLEKLKAEATA
jgi:hypothetical protein